MASHFYSPLTVWVDMQPLIYKLKAEFWNKKQKKRIRPNLGCYIFTFPDYSLLSLHVSQISTYTTTSIVRGFKYSHSSVWFVHFCNHCMQQRNFACWETGSKFAIWWSATVVWATLTQSSAPQLTSCSQGLLGLCEFWACRDANSVAKLN